MSDELVLRRIARDDLRHFFEQQLDHETNYMAAFKPKDPTDPQAFMAHWDLTLADDTVILQTILRNGQVAGSVSSYEEQGRPESLIGLESNIGAEVSPPGRLRSF